jgi:hypothetical protein
MRRDFLDTYRAWQGAMEQLNTVRGAKRTTNWIMSGFGAFDIVREAFGGRGSAGERAQRIVGRELTTRAGQYYVDSTILGPGEDMFTQMAEGFMRQLVEKQRALEAAGC